MKIINKIKHLLNQTVDRGCTEEEAKTALALARKLMIKYQISIQDVKEPHEDDIIKLELHYDCNIFWIYSLLKVFLNNFGVMHFMINRHSELHCCLFGTNINVKCIETLMSCAFNYLLDASEKYINEYVELFGVRDENIKHSFRLGFINGLSDKYFEQNKMLDKKESLIIIPNKTIQNEFKNFTKDFKEQKIEYTEELKNNDFLAMQVGYNKGRMFGSTPLKS